MKVRVEVTLFIIIETLLLFLSKQGHLPASLSFKGQATKHTNAKWSIAFESRNSKAVSFQLLKLGKIIEPVAAQVHVLWDRDEDENAEELLQHGDS